MTDQDLIWEYDRLGDLAMDLDDELISINEKVEYTSLEMDSIERAWLESHSCSCGLMGVESSCSHDKN